MVFMMAFSAEVGKLHLVRKGSTRCDAAVDLVGTTDTSALVRLKEDGVLDKLDVEPGGRIPSKMEEVVAMLIVPSRSSSVFPAVLFVVSSGWGGVSPVAFSP